MAGLFQKTQEAYYQQSQSSFSTEPDGSQLTFTLTNVFFPSIPSAKTDIRVFVNDVEIDTDNYGYNGSTGVITFSGNTNNTNELESDGAPKANATLKVQERALSESFGTYQYVSLDDVVNNFLIAYVGENKVIPKVKRTDVAILMVEQNAKQALSISDRGYVLVTGQNKFEGSGKDLLNDPEVRRSFLGV